MCMCMVEVFVFRVSVGAACIHITSMPYKAQQNLVFTQLIFRTQFFGGSSSYILEFYWTRARPFHNSKALDQ